MDNVFKHMFFFICNAYLISQTADLEARVRPMHRGWGMLLPLNLISDCRRFVFLSIKDAVQFIDLKFKPDKK